MISTYQIIPQDQPTLLSQSSHMHQDMKINERLSVSIYINVRIVVLNVPSIRSKDPSHVSHAMNLIITIPSYSDLVSVKITPILITQHLEKIK